MVTIQTGPLCGHAVQFSPFTGNHLAFAGAENYGIAGKSFVNCDCLSTRKLNLLFVCLQVAELVWYLKEILVELGTK